MVLLNLGKTNQSFQGMSGLYLGMFGFLYIFGDIKRIYECMWLQKKGKIVWFGLD